MTTPHISVVTPVYGYQLDLPALYQRLCAAITPITPHFEIIMVNDQSPDNAWQVIQELAARDQRVRGINLSRNFGQHQAITAGLEFVRGDWCVIMDCDLQDQPEEIPKLYAKAQEGFDSVVGMRVQRKDDLSVRITSKLFYKLFNYLTDQELDHRVANFGVYSRRVIDAVKRYKEAGRSVGLLLLQVGFPRCQIEIQHAQREVGSSTYTFKKRLQTAQSHILSYSTKPLQLVVKTGFFVVSFSFFLAVYFIFRYLKWGSETPGWTSLIVVLLFLSGLLISVVGIIGLYVGQIYNEVKNRPLFLVAETTFAVQSIVNQQNGEKIF
ncbi:MAG: glycosyltransferase family 2 protein [Magnetococcales bacterium]|nr:glycosyltransferase family 2 protein [Magnetococcales bacterium]NGZ25526.1 glycosyltransferase family 2 protein [Magnetococcales bacterium]